MSSHNARTPSLVLGACLLACALVAATGASAAGDPNAGTPVKVTPEKRGAGAVSAGVPLPPVPPATGSREHPVRLIEVAPDKRVLWEFTTPDLSIYRGNDDVFFSPDGNKLMVNEEDNYDIHIIDYTGRTIVWSYGQADIKGHGPNQFDFPDDAHLLPDGSVVVIAHLGGR